MHSESDTCLWVRGFFQARERHRGPFSTAMPTEAHQPARHAAVQSTRLVPWRNSGPGRRAEIGAGIEASREQWRTGAHSGDQRRRVALVAQDGPMCNKLPIGERCVVQVGEPTSGWARGCRLSGGWAQPTTTWASGRVRKASTTVGS
jgi:hypothetical protein